MGPEMDRTNQTAPFHIIFKCVTCMWTCKIAVQVGLIRVGIGYISGMTRSGSMAAGCLGYAFGSASSVYHTQSGARG